MSTDSPFPTSSVPGGSPLRIELPHWAAEVRLFDDLYRPVAGIPPLLDAGEGRYATELSVSPGIYDLEVSFLGNTLRDTISVPRSGKKTVWSGIGRDALAPSPVVAATNQPLEQLIRDKKETWNGRQGDSRLLLSVRALSADGSPAPPLQMQLMQPSTQPDVADTLVTDFNGNTESNPSVGSVAFSANLAHGCYVLQSQLPSGGTWCRPICLSPGWETCLAITAELRGEGPRIVSLRMARVGMATTPNEAAAVASIAVLDALTHGTDTQSFITKAHIDALTLGESADPWLAVLASYALLQSIESRPFRTRRDVNPESASLLADLRGFLARELPEHPDTRAILLEEKKGTSAPFVFPPLLRAGFKRVQLHAAGTKGTIGPGSLMDRLLDEPTLGSTWSTWIKQPQRDARAPVDTPRVERPVFLRNLGAKAPIFRINQPAFAEGYSGIADPPTRDDALSAREMLRDAKIVELVDDAVYDQARSVPFSALKFDESVALNQLLSVTPEELCKETGLPIDHVENALAALRGDLPAARGSAAASPTRIGAAEEQLVAYAVGNKAFEAKTPGDTPGITIEEVVLTLKSIADSVVSVPPASPADAERVGRFVIDIGRVIEALLKRASLIALTTTSGSIIYGNGAFLAYLDLGVFPRDSLADARPASWAPQDSWENALHSASVGNAFLRHVGGSTDGTLWKLQRARVNENARPSEIAFANVLTIDGAPTIDVPTLDKVGVLAHRVSLGASIFALGATEERDAHGRNAEQSLAELKLLLGITPDRTSAETPMSNPASLFDVFFSIERHELIAAAADQLIAETTSAEVTRIVAPLGAGVALVDLAAWADRIKRRKPTPEDDEDTRVFLEDERNAKQDTWHYVDIPAKAAAYDRAKLPDFTRDDDVVQMLTEAIKVLRKQSTRFSELNALRLVVHLVGDVHQPVHIGCSFIDASGAKPKLVLDPKVAALKQLPSDHGGNLVMLPIGAKGTGLHGYWDSRLGGKVKLDDLTGENDSPASDEGDPPAASPAEAKAMVDRLVAMVRADRAAALGAESEAIPAGPPDTWPILWANESLVAARSAYQGLTIDRLEGTKSPRAFVKWKSREAYDARNGPIVVDRMKAAASNLATLLDTVLG